MDGDTTRNSSLGAPLDNGLYNGILGAALKPLFPVSKLSSFPIYNNTVLLLDPANVQSYSGGSIWNDLSGRNNNGTLVNNPIFSTDNRGIFFFSATGSFINFSDSADFDIGISARPFTWEVWFYPISASGSMVGIARGGGTASWSSSGHSYLASYGSNGSLNFQFSIGGTSFTTISSSAGIAGINRWHYFAITFNGTTTTLYLNGNVVASGGGGYTKPTSTNRTRLARSTADGDSSAGHFESFVRIINGLALSQNEIRSNFEILSRRYF